MKIIHCVHLSMLCSSFLPTTQHNSLQTAAETRYENEAQTFGQKPLQLTNHFKANNK